MTPNDTRQEERSDVADSVPPAQVWDRIRNVDRDWSQEAESEAEPEQERERPDTRPAQVLVPFDDSEPARDALEFAFDLFPDADVTALLIIDDSAIATVPPPSSGEDDSATANRVLDSVPGVLEHAIEIGDRCDGQVRTAGRIGSPTQAILEYIDDESVDHVVIGSAHRTGISRLLLGSVAEVVVRHAKVPVTVAPAPPGDDD